MNSIFKATGRLLHLCSSTVFNHYFLLPVETGIPQKSHLQPAGLWRAITFHWRGKATRSNLGPCRGSGLKPAAAWPPHSGGAMVLHLQLLASKSPQVRGCRGKLLCSYLSMPSCVGLHLAEITVPGWIKPTRGGLQQRTAHRLKQSLRPSQRGQQEKLPLLKAHFTGRLQFDCYQLPAAELG